MFQKSRSGKKIRVCIKSLTTQMGNPLVVVIVEIVMVGVELQRVQVHFSLQCSKFFVVRAWQNSLPQRASVGCGDVTPTIKSRGMVFSVNKIPPK